MKTLLQQGYLLGGKWRLGNLIGTGACGQVFAVEHLSEHFDFPLVAKCVEYGKGMSGPAKKERERMSSTLNRERTLLAPGMLLRQFKYRPRIPEPKMRTDFFGKDEQAGVVFLVMERLGGGDLRAWAERHNDPTPAQISAIGLQLLDGLSWLHREKSMLFIDLKPDNFMFRSENEVVFIDYGLTENFRSFSTGGNREQTDTANNGTPAFLSLAVHEGATPSPKDDIESMCLVLLSLASRGDLPWSTTTSDRECLQLKQTCDLHRLCHTHGLDQLCEIILTCRQLEYGAMPNYDDIKQSLQQMRLNNNNNNNRRSTSNNSTTKKRKSATNSSAPEKQDELPQSTSATTTTTATTMIVDESNLVSPVQVAVDKPKRNPPVKKAKAATTATTTTTSAVETPSAANLPDIVAPAKSTRAKAANKIAETTTNTETETTTALEIVPSDPPRSTTTTTEKVIKTVKKAKQPSPSKPHVTTRSPQRANALLANENSSSSSSNNNNNNNNNNNQDVRFAVVDGPHTGETIVVKAPTTTTTTTTTSRDGKVIGRGECSDVCLDKDDSVSESHSLLVWSQNAAGKLALSIQDNKSTNGTILNGIKIRSVKPLHSGDFIRMGETKLQVL